MAILKIKAYPLILFMLALCSPGLLMAQPEDAMQSPPPQGLQLWIILSQPVAGVEEDRATQVDHHNHQLELEQNGILFGAGPYSDADGNYQGGLIVIRAANRAEAVKIADSDPMHSRGMRQYSLLQWSLYEGHLGVSLHYSSGTFKFQ